MRPLLQEIETAHTPESLVEQGRGMPGVVLLRSGLFDSPQARYSFVAARPFLTFCSLGSRCELMSGETCDIQFGNPWRILDVLMARYELLDEVDLPFPLGGCFGYWGYDLKNFVEPKLPRRAVNDLELPDCHVGFYDSLVVFDHRLGKTWIVSTGLSVDGSRSEDRAQEQIEFWRKLTWNRPRQPSTTDHQSIDKAIFRATASRITHHASSPISPALISSPPSNARSVTSAPETFIRSTFRNASPACPLSGWEFFQRLSAVSPAPFAAYLDCGEFQIASSSPEHFLRLSGSHILTRPIKGTRPRSADPTRDAQLTYELQTSPKELAELVMITDLLRNDLGKVCEFGSVQVPELGAAGTLRAGAASGFHRRRPVAQRRDAFRRVRVVFSRRQHHRRAEIPRDGNH